MQSQTIMTMTRTRRKQKQELLKRALVAAEERKSEERQSYFLLGSRPSYSLPLHPS